MKPKYICPFCGSIDVEEIPLNEKYFAVTCRECGAHGPFESSPRKAVEKWDEWLKVVFDEERWQGLERYG